MTSRSSRYVATLLALSLAVAGAACAQGGEVGRSYQGLEQVHVDPVDGFDGNAGTSESPVATLGEGLERALRNRELGLGTRVLLQPGVYREGVDDYFDDSAGPTIVIQSAAPGEAIVSGSDVWDDWSCGGSICTHDWPYDWSEDRNPWPEAELSEIGTRREMVFVNGERLQQTLARSEMEGRQGSFHVDEGADLLYMNLPSDTSVDDALVEVAVRPHLFHAQTLHDLVIDGLVFQHAATPLSRSAVYVVEQDRVTLENVTVRDNNWDGLNFALGSDLTLRRSRMVDNGGSGVGAYRSRNVVLEDNETSRNNWRGYAGGLTGWYVGHKFITVHGLTIRRHTSTENLTRGLWLDWDVHNAVLDEVRSCDNVSDGLFIEVSPGPITVQDSTFCDNGGAGIQTSAVRDFTMSGNEIYGNDDAQVSLTGDLEVPVDDYFTGQTHVLQNEGWLWHDNTFRALEDQPILTTTLPSDEWDRLMSSSSLDFARYEATGSNLFHTPSGARLSFGEWQAFTGQDSNSIFGTGSEVDGAD